jgi:hypothetical protein
MTNDEEIRRLLDEVKRTQEAFFAEWKAAREDTLRKEETLREEQARLRAATIARQKEYRIQVFIVFVVLALLVWQLNRPRLSGRPSADASAPSN